jgi:hypothetical protein
MFDAITPYALYATFHLLGVVLGAGAAFMSDISILSSIRSKMLSVMEVYIIELSNKIVWIGIALMAVSGVLLFLRDIEGYLASPEFLAKLTVAAVIFVNSSINHFKHLPLIRRVEGRPFDKDDVFVKYLSLVIASGAISIVSWLFIVFGALRDIPYSYTTIISAYLSAVLIAVVFGFVWKRISLGPALR